MECFEVRINNEDVVCGAVEKGVVTVIFTVLDNDCIDVSLSGLRRGEDCHIRWFSKKLEVGDKIRVKRVDTDEISPVTETWSRESILMSEYESLKRQLEKEGLI